jgi:hypothetical protein
MLAQIRYITDDIDNIPIHHMKKARSVIRVFLEWEVSTGLHQIKFEEIKPTDFAKYLRTLSNPVTGCLFS